MSPVALTLLGGFEVRLDGELRELPGQKDRALLALLALAPGTAQPRERLAELLWGERGDSQARDSLKHALARVRAALDRDGVGPLEADRHAVRLDSRAVVVDVAEFERQLTEGSPEALETALAHYRGDLLDGVAVRDPAFEDWLRVERARLRGHAEEAAAGLMARALAEGADDQAAAAARRLLALDPLREDACRALMRHHAGRGEAARALRLYAELRDGLQRDLAVRPEPETDALAETIRRGDRAARALDGGPPPLPTGRPSRCCRSRTSAAIRSRSISPTGSSRRSSPRCRGCAGCS
jgi:DNA-binding SARP family transcriptional activator